jgi:hypothetical protein
VVIPHLLLKRQRLFPSKKPDCLYGTGTGNSLSLCQPSQSAWSILEAVYDGPIDMVKFTPVPVILEKTSCDD